MRQAEAFARFRRAVLESLAPPFEWLDTVVSAPNVTAPDTIRTVQNAAAVVYVLRTYQYMHESATDIQAADITIALPALSFLRHSSRSHLLGDVGRWPLHSGLQGHVEGIA